MKDTQQYTNKYDFFFTFKKNKITTKEKLWNYSPVLFLIYLLTLNGIINVTIVNPTIKVHDHYVAENELIYGVKPFPNSIKNTTFISED